MGDADSVHSGAVRHYLASSVVTLSLHQPSAHLHPGETLPTFYCHTFIPDSVLYNYLTFTYVSLELSQKQLLPFGKLFCSSHSTASLNSWEFKFQAYWIIPHSNLHACWNPQTHLRMLQQYSTYKGSPCERSKVALCCRWD